MQLTMLGRILNDTMIFDILNIRKVQTVLTPKDSEHMQKEWTQQDVRETMENPRINEAVRRLETQIAMAALSL
jgi:hypothetical protein